MVDLRFLMMVDGERDEMVRDEMVDHIIFLPSHLTTYHLTHLASLIGFGTYIDIQIEQSSDAFMGEMVDEMVDDEMVDEITW